MSDTKRVQFNFTEQRVEDFDKLQDLMDIPTRRELVDNAMLLLEWAAEEKRKGREIGASDGERFYPVKVPRLERVPESKPDPAKDRQNGEPAR